MTTTTTTTTTTPAPKPDAQPVQAATHTPGPWAVLNVENEKAEVWYRPNDGLASLIACTYECSICEEHGGGGAANARLIAAAPALLAALEAIHEAGRMSSQPRAVYCALIAEDALIAAKGGAQ